MRRKANAFFAGLLEFRILQIKAVYQLPWKITDAEVALVPKEPTLAILLASWPTTQWTSSTGLFGNWQRRPSQSIREWKAIGYVFEGCADVKSKFPKGWFALESGTVADEQLTGHGWKSAEIALMEHE